MLPERIQKILNISSKIGQLKVKLRNTDYLAIKYAEGILTLSEYQPVKIQRQTWRNEINTLETELKTLRDSDL